MSYPQPDANLYAANGSKFFRLNTPLVSGGDIYESDQSCLSFCIGAESDISRVRVTYFDKQAPDFINQVVVGADRQFAGRLDANPRDSYTPSKRPGKILIAPDNLYVPDWQLQNPVVPNSFISVPPVMDVIQYFNAPPTLVPGRNDKTFRFESLAWPQNSTIRGNIYLAIPYYGRTFCDWKFVSLGAAPAFSVVVLGMIFNYSNNTPAEFGLGGSAASASSQTGLVNSLTLGAPTTAGNANLGPRGLFDYLIFELIPTINTDLDQPGVFASLIVSDKR